MKKIIIAAILGLTSALYSADVVVYPRSTGYPYQCPAPKTGQTNSYATGDDGEFQKGVAWPAVRFTVQDNTNCVRDNLTGLIWARNANQFGKQAWSNALDSCNGLDCGGQTDWRLPNREELLSLVDVSTYNPAIPTGHPFEAVAVDEVYWSSTTGAGNTSYGRAVYLYDGRVTAPTKVTACYVWPVRGP
jgi:hypothetical protein